MAKMEVDYNLKTSCERFQILCLCLAKIIENLLWFALLEKFTWYLPLGVPGAFCVRAKAFNLNFREVLTKREENSRDTAPLISLWMQCTGFHSIAACALWSSYLIAFFPHWFVAGFDLFCAGGGRGEGRNGSSHLIRWLNSLKMVLPVMPLFH